MTIRCLSLAVCVVFQSFDGLAQTSSTPPDTIVLDRGWKTPIQGGSATMKDLGVLLSPFAKPAENTSPVPGLKIYGGVSYLMPLEQAKSVLGITQNVVAKNKVVCAGFPKDSFFHYAFDGNFDGHFNKLYIVVDKADQVVAIQLVAEKPQIRDFGVIYLNYEKMDWHTYNFVNSRSKGSTRLLIEFKQMFETKDRWMTYKATMSSMQPKTEIDLLRLESILVNPGSGQSTKEQKALEAVRLYLPRPVMELILSCVYGKGR